MNSAIQRDHATPIYVQLKDRIQAEIDNGNIAPGQGLPSENELSRKFKVHRNTVRTALLYLQLSGLIHSVPGAGWFVKAREKPVRNIGLVSIDGDYSLPPEYYSTFNWRLHSGIADGEKQYNFNICRITNSNVDEFISNLTVDGKKLDGLLWLNILPTQMDLLQEFRRRKLPILLVNRKVFGEGIPCIYIDQYYSSRDLVSRLIAAGHKKIGCIKYELPLTYVSERFRGYCDALHEAGMEPENKLICKIKSSEHAKRKLRSFFQRNPDMTGLFVSGEAFHQYVFEVLEKLEIGIPGDLSVVAFDNPNGLCPGVTCAEQPLEELSRRAFRAMNALLAGGEVSGEILQPTIILGDSIKELRK